MTVEPTQLAPIVRPIKTPLETVALGSQPTAPHACPVVNPNVAAANRQKNLIDEWNWLEKNAGRSEPARDVVALGIAEDASSIVQPASAQVIGLPPKQLAKSALPDSGLTPAQPASLAPIISPSQRMQEIRTAERKQVAERAAAAATLRLPPSPAPRPESTAAANTSEEDPRDDSRWTLPSMPTTIPSLNPEELVPMDAMGHVGGDLKAAAQGLRPAAPQSPATATRQPAVNALQDSQLMPAMPDFSAVRGAAGAQAALQHFDESQFAGVPLPKKY
jgi:hypothetical protein